MSGYVKAKVGHGSLCEDTNSAVRGWCQALAPRSDNIQFGTQLIVTEEDRCFSVTVQLEEIDVDLGGATLLEPVGRNTVPALTFWALAPMEQGEDPALLAISANQLAPNLEAYQKVSQITIYELSTFTIVILGATISFQGEGLNEEADVADMTTDTAFPLKADNVILNVYPRHFSRTEVEKLLGDPSKVRHGWAGDHSPANCFRANYMVMEQVKKSSLLNMHGFPSPICFV